MSKDTLFDSSYPTWRKAFNFWKKLDVPFVTIRPFHPNTGNLEEPWYCKKNNRAIAYESNVLMRTARLIHHLKTATKEQQFLFMIDGFSREYSYLGGKFLRAILDGRDKHDKDDCIGWGGRGKYFLPNTRADRDIIRFIMNHPKERAWKKVLKLAAKKWTSISEEYEIIDLPKYQPVDSVAYRAYENALTNKKLELMRIEYEYLKGIFEPE